MARTKKPRAKKKPLKKHLIVYMDEDERLRVLKAVDLAAERLGVPLSTSLWLLKAALAAADREEAESRG